MDPNSNTTKRPRLILLTVRISVLLSKCPRKCPPLRRRTTIADDRFVRRLSTNESSLSLALCFLRCFRTCVGRFSERPRNDDSGRRPCFGGRTLSSKNQTKPRRETKVKSRRRRNRVFFE